MTLDKKSLGIVAMMVLTAWLSFIFVDGAFSSWSRAANPQQRSPSPSANTASIAGQLDLPDTTHASASQTPIHPDAEVSLPSVAQRESSLQDIRVLKSLYDKTADTKVLVSLIQRLAANYQFADANRYLQLLMQEADYQKRLDPQVVLYVLLHADSLSLQDANALETIAPLIDRYRNQWLLTRNDELFYQWLLAIWQKKYLDASNYRSSLSTSRYANIVQSYTQAMADYSGSQHVPAHYQDALIALTMLKNGYFSFAKRLALSALLQDSEYVLPYQILAYANFLSNHRDVAAEYFLKLVNFDKMNTDRYLFLVGVSYYRHGEYQKALLYLAQVTTSPLLTDVYRYHLLSYIAMDDMDNAVRIRQKLLGQPDLQQSDFLMFFSIFFYQPYVNGQSFALFRTHTQLVTFYTDVCARVLWSGDSACLYGEVWQALSTSTLAWLRDKLLYLSSVYHHASVLHVLGDYYFQDKEFDLAKQTYLQALRLAPSPGEERLLKAKLDWSSGK